MDRNLVFRVQDTPDTLQTFYLYVADSGQRDRTAPSLLYSSTWRYCKEWDDAIDVWGVGHYGCYPPTPETGESQEPITSIRIEAARDGVEDFCYLQQLQKLAEKTGDPAAQALLTEFLRFSEIPNAGGRYSSANLNDPDRMLALRIEMGYAIERLTEMKK